MQFLRPFYRYFEFSGRSGRAEFWQYMALLVGLGAVVWVLDFNALMQSVAMGVPHISGLTILFNIATIIPTTAVIFRRLHDRGFSGWTFGAVYIALIPIFIVLIVALAGMKDNSGETSLGPLLIAMFLSLLIYEIYIIVQLASAGDDFDNFYGAPDNALFEPFKGFQQDRPVSRALDPTTNGDREAGTEATAGQMDDIVLKIERLANLHSLGHLTDDEFTTQKGRLLASVN